MDRAKVVLDRRELAGLLQDEPEIVSLVREVANEVAANVRASLRDPFAGTVEVDEYTTDRSAASVTIVHPAGEALEAKYGTLAKAALAAGVDFRATKD